MNLRQASLRREQHQIWPCEVLFLRGKAKDNTLETKRDFLYPFFFFSRGQRGHCILEKIKMQCPRLIYMETGSSLQ